jgi:two-component system sensor histidine kinase TctE
LAKALGVTPVSLRINLIRRLSAALAAIGVAGVIGAFYLAQRYANLAYDRALFDDVITLAEAVSFDGDTLQVNFPPAMQRWLLNDEGELVLYRIVDLRSGRILQSNGDLNAIPVDAGIAGQAYYRDSVIKGRLFRIAYTRHLVDPADWPILIEIGETVSRRESLTEQVLLGASLLLLIMILTAAALVWHEIGKTFEPLSDLEREVIKRSAADLAPLDLTHVPQEVLRLIASVNDMMTRLSESIAAQKRFIANAAHQLRTPIAGLRLRSQLLLKQGLAEATRGGLLEIEAEAARLAHLLDQMLTLSKLDSRELIGQATLVDAVAIARLVIERHMQQAIVRNIDLGYEGESTPVQMLANDVLLAEMLANLVDNAIRYGRANGLVTVAVRKISTVISIEVADDGPGLQDTDKQRVFQRFYRGDSSAPGGAGLGLSIVQEIAERYGGRLSVESQPGACRFRIDFPAC